jgi:tetratricopeptide (TPR) repeat protein
MLSYSIYDRTRRGMALATLGAMACGQALAASTADNIRQALQSGQLEQASRLVQQERQLNPRDVQIRFLEGVVQAQLGQTDKAIESFGKLVESNPEIVEAHNNLGVLYASKGRLEDARKALEAGMQAHSGYATLHRNLGDVQSQLARQTYAKALQVDSKSRQAIPQLSLLGGMGALPAQAPAAPAALPPATAVPASPAVATTSPAPTTPPAVSTPPAQALAPKVAAAKPETALPSPPSATRPAAPPSTPVPQPPASAPASKSDAGKAEARAVQPPPPDRAEATEVDAIRHAVQAWAKAWSRKDMEHYLDAYAPNFSPPEQQPRSKWEADRRQRILSKKSISVELRQLKISANGKTGTAQFQQIYTSDNFTGNSRKTLEMVKQGSRWLIVRETVN